MNRLLIIIILLLIITVPVKAITIEQWVLPNNIQYTCVTDLDCHNMFPNETVKCNQVCYVWGALNTELNTDDPNSMVHDVENWLMQMYNNLENNYNSNPDWFMAGALFLLAAGFYWYETRDKKKNSYFKGF